MYVYTYDHHLPRVYGLAIPWVWFNVACDISRSSRHFAFISRLSKLLLQPGLAGSISPQNTLPHLMFVSLSLCFLYLQTYILLFICFFFCIFFLLKWRQSDTSYSLAIRHMSLSFTLASRLRCLLPSTSIHLPQPINHSFHCVAAFSSPTPAESF